MSLHVYGQMFPDELAAVDACATAPCPQR